MKVSGIFFAIVIIAFLMPFMVVKCGDNKIATVSGFKLVTGGKVANPQLENLQNMTESMQGQTDNETPDAEAEENDNTIPFKSNPYALIALLAALAGLISALLLKKGAFVAPLALAIVGLISMMLIKGPVTNAAKGSSGGNAALEGIITVNAQFGYYLALIGFFLAGITAVLLGRKEPVISREQFSQYVPDSVENAFDKAKDTVGTVGAGLATKLDDAVDAAKDKFTETVETVKDKYEDTVETVKEKIDTSGIEEKIDAVADKVKGMVGPDGNIAETLNDAHEHVEEFIADDEDKPQT